ncbi:amino acid ABC transporter substrate-binding protein [Paenibacillus herberti]|uniref:Amino acid ABC transporter substrate-binding protein n=1 Tax=Paenibacillus herberti TaxID=1619309 RepID=A0A229NXJ8_9BACL|nr:amino acid ABC transporter substrate-binding protein [Paenibacillus herberti]OXM14643.1 amino acid ABC transporter substrate-binding protein [Paenibacillus herberti]
MKRKSFAALLLIVTVLILAACGSKNNNTNTPAPSESPATNATGETGAGGDSWEAIKASGKMRIGTEGTYAPFSFNDASGKLTGFDVEIAEEVAKRLGLEPEFSQTPWDSLIAGLDAKRFDVIFNQVGINDERKAKYDFSDDYIVSKAVLIVREDNNDIKTFADLKGKKSGQTLSSNLATLAKNNGAEIVSVDGFNQAIDLLASKRIDATVNDSLSFLDLKKQKPELPMKIAVEATDASKNAALFRKGNEGFVKAVNEALTGMKSDGTYLKISEKYFGEDVSK